MPFSKKDDYRKAHRLLFAARYAEDEKFRAAEAARKASWYERNKEKVIARVLARRAEAGK